MKHTGTKALSVLLTLAMVVGLMPGVSLTARAADSEESDIMTPLTFDAEESGITVTLRNPGNGTQYNKNNTGWCDYTASSPISLSASETFGYLLLYCHANCLRKFLCAVMTLSDSSRAFNLNFYV